MNFLLRIKITAAVLLHDCVKVFQESGGFSRLGLIDGDISSNSDVFQLRTALLIEVEMSCDFVRFSGIVFNQLFAATDT